MKGGRQKQEFQERQQRNRIISQLERLYAVGNTVEDIREAGNDAWLELGGPDIVKDPLTGEFSYGAGGPTNYTVRDGDTVATIADKTGTTPSGVLNSNPDMKQLKTGMVINAPTAQNAQMRGRGYGANGSLNNPATGSLPNVALGEGFTGGIGLPSNAPLGITGSISGGAGGTAALNPNNRYTTTQGSNPLAGLFGTRTGQQPYQKTPQGIRPATGQAQNPLSGIFGRPGQQPYTRGPGGVLPVTPVADLSAQQAAMRGRGYGQVAPSQTVINTAQPPPFKSGTMLEENYHLRTLERVLTTNNYTQDDINYLTKIGLLKPRTQPPSFAGGGGYGGRGGRGGGGGGGGGARISGGASPRGGGVQQAPRLPAFSSGASFRGLVNWRI
jgi:hypothetical protein